MKKKLILPAFLFLLCHLICFSQNNAIDSLSNALKKNQADTNKINCLNKLSWEYKNIGSYDSAMQFASRALQLSEKINYLKGVANACNQIGTIYNNQSEFYNALNYYLKALKINEQLSDKVGVAKLLGNIGTVYWNLGNYPKAIDYCFDALKKSEQLANKREIAKNFDNIGLVYHSQREYAKALDYHFKALKIREEIGVQHEIARTCNNIGGVFLEQKEYEKALQYYFKALNIRNELGYKTNMSINLNGIGIVYTEQGEYLKAEEYYFKALKMAKELGEKNNIAIILGNFGTLYIETKKNAEAEKYLLQSYLLSDSIGDLYGMLEMSTHLSQLYEKNHNPVKALIYYKKSMLAKDSLFNQEKNNEIIQKEMNYDFEKKELATKLEEEKKLNDFKIAAQQKSTRQNIVLIILLAILLIISIGAYFIYRNYKQKQTIRDYEKNSLKQKLLLSQMNPHFIFNSIDNIQGLIHNNQNQDAVDYLTGFSKLTRQILENSSQTYISFSEEINMIENYLKIQQLLHNNSFSYSIVVSDTIDQENIFMPPMLTQPFIENSIKHGVNTKTKKGEIKIDFLLDDKKLIVKITDTGKGFQDKEKESNHKSMAINITKERLNNYTLKQDSLIQLNNVFDNNNQVIGAQVVVEIPYIYET